MWKMWWKYNFCVSFMYLTSLHTDHHFCLCFHRTLSHFSFYPCANFSTSAKLKNHSCNISRFPQMSGVSTLGFFYARIENAHKNKHHYSSKTFLGFTGREESRILIWKYLKMISFGHIFSVQQEMNEKTNTGIELENVFLVSLYL